MTRAELRQLIVGPIATVPTAFTAAYAVDYARMAKATEQWIANGLVRGRSALKVAASIGEGQMLREAEWVRLLATVVEAARGRVPVLGAIHHKDTVRTVEDAKRAADAGVIGLQISPPIFNQPTQDDLLRYFGAVSEQIDLGIVIYATPAWRFGAIQPETFARMADFERVCAIKWTPPEGVAYDAIFDLADRFSILDNDRQAVRCHQLGGRGFLIDGIACYPPYYLGVWDLLEAGRYDAARAEWERVVTPLWALYERVTGRSGGDGKVEKGMSAIMGIPTGPPRPPSVPLTDGELNELRRRMVAWGWPVPDLGPAGHAPA